MKKDVVVGIGEIGKPILKLLSNENTVVGYDIDSSLMDKKNLKHIKILKLHFCILLFL